LISGYGSTHTYAPTGERVSSAYSSTTYYGQDLVPSGGLSDVVAEYDSAGTRQVRYTHGLGADEPVEQLRSGAYYTYQKDGLGSVSRITDASQNSVNTYTYSPWGDTSGGGSLSNPFQYTGREADAGSQAYHYRARVYDPAARRFLTKDPAGMISGTNRYAFAGDNPVRLTDPSGMRFQEGPDDPPPSYGTGGTSFAGAASASGPSAGGTKNCGEEQVMFLIGFCLSFLGLGLERAEMLRIAGAVVGLG